MKLLFITLALFSLSAHADEWREADTYRESAYLTLHVMDWLQTRHIANNPDKFHEKNPILGTHPAVEQVDTYFAATGLLHYYVASILPAEYRKGFQYITIGMQAKSVSNNIALGIKFNF